MPSSSTILIKRRRTGSAGSPATLRNGELAFNEISNVLYYGHGADNNANATNIIPIGGREYFTITYPVDTPESLVGGETTDYYTIPHDLKIISWTMLSDVSGSVQVDVKTCSFESYPNLTSICNGNLPHIMDGVKNRDLDVADWDEYIPQDSILMIQATSAVDIDRVTVILKCERF
jgi:hypothetical protein